MKNLKLILVFSFIFTSVMATFAGSATNAYVRKVQVDANGNSVYFYTSSHDNTPAGSAASPGHMGEPNAEN